MDYSFNPHKDYIMVSGINGSGKTLLIANFWLNKVDKKNVYVLNSSRENTWSRIGIPEENIIKPIRFDKKWFDLFLLEFVSSHTNCLLVLDDCDNFSFRESEILKSVIINARHMGIGIILSTRSLQSIPRVLYNQAKYCCFSVQRVKYDIIYLGYTIGEVAYLLNNLGKYEFMIYDMNNKQYSVVKLALNYNYKKPNKGNNKVKK